MAINFDALAQYLGGSVNADPFMSLAAQNQPQGSGIPGQMSPNINNLIQQLAAPNPVGVLASANQPDPSNLITAGLIAQNNAQQDMGQDNREAELAELLKQIQGNVPAPPPRPQVDPNFRGGPQGFPNAGAAPQAQNIMAALLQQGQGTAPGLAQLMQPQQRRR